MMRTDTISKELCEVNSIYIPREETCYDICYKYFYYYCCFRCYNI